MQDLTPLLARTIKRRDLLGPADRVAIAISGGADSVALALGLGELAGRGVAPVAGLIHVNHGLRGAESDADEAFCRALADRLGQPIEVTRVDAAALARQRGCSIEVAARGARYSFFPEAAARLGATVVATAHTLDDQAETVLLRLLRGAGTRGLSGIRPRRGLYVRPLIDTPRAAIARYLATRGETWREDASNADTSIPRNRVRHELMPVIARLAPGGVRALARLADLAADDDEVLSGLAIEMLPTLVLTSGTAPGIRLDARLMSQAPAAVARRVIRLAVEAIAPGTALGVRHLEAVRGLAAADTPKGPLDLPGLRAQRWDAVLALLPAIGRAAEPSGAARPFRRTLNVPGSVSIPEAGVVITARVGEPSDWETTGPRAVDGNRAVLRAGAIAAPLVVRSRRPGDRLRPLGAPGRRKLQDVLVDRKVPREQRDLVPIVEDANGRVLWVAGVAVAEEGRVTTPEAGVVILEMRKDR